MAVCLEWLWCGSVRQKSIIISAVWQCTVPSQHWKRVETQRNMRRGSAGGRKGGNNSRQGLKGGRIGRKEAGWEQRCAKIMVADRHSEVADWRVSWPRASPKTMYHVGGGDSSYMHKTCK